MFDLVKETEKQFVQAGAKESKKFGIFWTKTHVNPAARSDFFYGISVKWELYYIKAYISCTAHTPVRSAFHASRYIAPGWTA